MNGFFELVFSVPNRILFSPFLHYWFGSLLFKESFCFYLTRLFSYLLLCGKNRYLGLVTIETLCFTTYIQMVLKILWFVGIIMAGKGSQYKPFEMSIFLGALLCKVFSVSCLLHFPHLSKSEFFGRNLMHDLIKQTIWTVPGCERLTEDVRKKWGCDYGIFFQGQRFFLTLLIMHLDYGLQQ